MGITADGHSGATRVALIGAAAGVLVVAVTAASSVTGVLAATTQAQEMRATAVIQAPPDATWYGQMTASAICGMLPGCVGASPTPKGYRMTLKGAIPGLGEIQQDVTATIIKRTPPRLLRLRLSSQSGYGSLAATADIALSPKGKKSTTLTVTVKRAAGTGALGSIMLPFFATRLQPGVSAYAQDLNQQRRASGIAVRATIKPKGKKRVVTVRVRQWNTLVQPTPTASGKARVTTAKGKVACTTRIKKSHGKCSYRNGPEKPRVIVTGVYSSGFPIWHATKVKAAK